METGSLSSCTEPPNNMAEVYHRNEMAQLPKSPAVQVSNAIKAYTSQQPVLKDFNMTVAQGTIYALLGSSGCGKTTMLSCIVGTSKLDSGDVFVFGQRPGTRGSGIPGRRIGYMPQDLSLNLGLSVQEMLEYFGRLYGMTDSEIGARIESLTNLLNLPCKSKLIETLSGGQQRRISLAATLLHEPPLLILDEPTVGVDPLLRESIWNHLLELSKRQTTVIITTHYIEEARNSNTVGLMRNGRLLVEKGPNALLKEYNVILLEDIVLSLCKKDSSTVTNDEDGVSEALGHISFYGRKTLLPSQQNDSELLDQEEVQGLKYRRRFSNEFHLNSSPLDLLPKGLLVGHDNEGGLSTRLRNKVGRIRALASRNIALLCRSPLILCILFGIPILNLSISSYTLGPNPKNLKFGVVNPEVENNLSFCSSVAQTQNVERCQLDKISCRFLDHLPNDILILESRNSAAEALEDVRNGVLWGYMAFPQDYSNHTVDKLVTGSYAEKETLDGSTVAFRLDMSSYIAAYIVQKSIYESFQSHARRMLTDCGHDTRMAELPLNFRSPIYGSEGGSSEEFINAGVLVITLYYLSTLFSFYAILEDRQQGTLERAKTAGLTHMEMYSAYYIVNGVIAILQIGVYYVMVVAVLQTQMQGSSMTYIALLFINAIGGLSLGLLLAEIFQNTMTACLAGIAMYVSSMTSCGVMWPLDASAVWVRTILESLPFTTTIAAVRSIQSRDWGITHPHIYSAFFYQIGWLFLTWIIAAVVRRLRAQ